MAGYNPVMFALARDSRGLTQEALADTVGASQGTLSKLEKGQFDPPKDLVERIAEALEFPLAFFSLAFERKNLPLTFYRKQKGLLKGPIRKIQARIAIQQLQITRLLQSVETPPVRVPQLDLKGFSGGADRLARELRIAWHVPSGPLDNVTRVIEAAGVMVVPFDFESRKIAGLSIYEKDSGVPPFIFVNSTMPGDRLRWTLAHELAHLIAHTHLPIPPQDEELQADRFAAEFLMPQSDIRGQLLGLNLMALASLKEHWKVSMQALIMRAWDIGELSTSGKAKLFAKLSMCDYRLHEPVEIRREEPSMLRAVINTHFEELGHSEVQVSEIALSTLPRFRSAYLPTPRPGGLRLVG
jgi:Zn-dependent peptidase ImmA (M78 family)/transcriptional regulator with XRE-family HTH domain